MAMSCGRRFRGAYGKTWVQTCFRESKTIKSYVIRHVLAEIDVRIRGFFRWSSILLGISGTFLRLFGFLYVVFELTNLTKLSPYLPL